MVDALRPTSAEGDHSERRENRESQPETGVSRCNLPVHLFLADGASDVPVDLFELACGRRRVRLAATDLGDPRQLGAIHWYRLSPATDIDIAVGGSVRDGVDRDRLSPGRHRSLI